MTPSIRHSTSIKNLSLRKKTFVETFTWQDVREQVKKTAPDLFNTIERLDPNNNYKLYKMRYPYGASIIDKKGIFNIPFHNHLIPINSNEIPSSLSEKVGYNQFSLPLSLVLSGQIHQFSEIEPNSIYTKDIYASGSILALPDIMDANVIYCTNYFWRLTAGVRTPVMLPSIAEEVSFMRLKRYFNLKLDKPENQQDHWNLFVELASKTYFPEKWYTELLVFSDKWVQHFDDNAWKQFKLCLLERSWKRSADARNIATMNPLWDQFTSNIRYKRLNNFVLNKVRYIIEASLNHSVVYIPFDNNISAGPFKSLIRIFLNIYRLKKHAPIIMVPEFYNENSQRPAYIPIQINGLNSAKIKTHKYGSIISDTRDVKYFLEMFINKLLQKEIFSTDNSLSRLSEINYFFYHADKDKYGELIPSSLALEDDPVMKKWQKHPTNNEIAYKNEFMRACVKMVKQGKQHNNK